jgi:hypothetical protein
VAEAAPTGWGDDDVVQLRPPLHRDERDTTVVAAGWRIAYHDDRVAESPGWQV